MQNSTKRNPVFDIAKGIGIILVVLGHACFKYSTFIYMFHMPLFLIISGYFFKVETVIEKKDLIGFCKRRIRLLYLPYVLTSMVFLFCTNFFIKLNFYIVKTVEPSILERGYDYVDQLSLSVVFDKLWKILVMYTREPIAGPTWFLKVLFFVVIFSAIGHYINKKIFKSEKGFEIARFFTYFICFLIGYFLSLVKFNFYQIGTIFTSSFFFYIGICYRKFNNKIKMSYPSFFISFLILWLAYIYQYPYNQYPYRTELYINQYYNPLIITITAIAGFIFVLSISEILNKKKAISNVFSYIGANTLIILCLHVMFFKFVTALHVYLYNEPISILYTHAIGHTTAQGWWIIYTLVGISGPIALHYVYLLIKKNITKVRGL